MTAIGNFHQLRDATRPTLHPHKNRPEGGGATRRYFKITKTVEVRCLCPRAG
jgi:hypothetical protein